MSDVTKAWVGVLVVFVVAAGAFWLGYRAERMPSDERGVLGVDIGQVRSDDHVVVRFFESLEKGDIRAVEDALAKRPDLLDQRFGSETALHVAARCNQADLIDVLLERGADRDARGRWNGTALHWACWFGSKAAVERLLDNGFDIEDKHDIFGSSPLLWAAHGSANVRSPKGDYPGTVLLLIGQGAKADTYNAQGVPAVVMASLRVAEILLANGAKMPTTRPVAGLTT